jgi:hypothetical protein
VVLLGSYRRRLVAILKPRSTQDGPAIPGLRVNLNTPLKKALARAMTRAPAERFDPLLITDSAGRFAGLARMEQHDHHCDLDRTLSGPAPAPGFDGRTSSHH